VVSDVNVSDVNPGTASNNVHGEWCDDSSPSVLKKGTGNFVFDGKFDGCSPVVLHIWFKESPLRYLGAD